MTKANKYTRLWTVIAVLCFSLILGCTRKHEQYGGQQSVDESRYNNVTGKKGVPGKPLAPGPDKEGFETSAQKDERRRKNSSQPIVYGKSLGGINLQTPRKEGEIILTDSFYDAGGVTAYDEQVIVAWREDTPYTPHVIAALGGYLGTLAMPSPYGTVKMNQEMKSFFPEDSDPTGEKFLKALYNHFEEVEDQNFDCIVELRCRVNIPQGGNSISFQLPRMNISFSKDSAKAITFISIFTPKDSGRFHNDFDIVNGEILIADPENPEILTEEKLSIGESWMLIQEEGALDPEAETEVYTRFFFKRYEGINVAISKTISYAQDYKEPDPEKEIVNGIVAYNQYLGDIRFGDKYVIIDFDMTTKTLSTQLSDTRVMNLEFDPDTEELLKGSIPLTVNLPFLSKQEAMQKSLIMNLASLMATAVEDKIQVLKNDSIVLKGFSGMHDDTSRRDFGFNISHLEKATGKGRRISVSINEDTGNMVFIHDQFDNEFDVRVYPALVNEAVAGSHSLGGFKLGEMVKVSDVDTGRAEGFFTSNDITTRAGIDLKAQIKAGYFDDSDLGTIEEKTQEVIFASGVSGVNLGLNKVAGQTDGEMVAEINSITISDSYLGDAFRLTSLCGMANFKVEFGIKDAEFTKSLKDAITAAKTAGEIQSCKYFRTVDSDGAGKLRVIYFPAQRVKLIFGERKLSAMTIYKKPGEQVGGGVQ